MAKIIKSNQIHIWLTYFPDEYKYTSYYESLLSVDEQQKMQSFRFLIDQQKYAISRGILRCLLEIYLNRESREIEILYGLWGKPCLSSNFQLYFNLSHSKDCVIYAFSRTSEIGIDLEYIDSSLDIDSIAPTILSSCELKLWHECPDEDKIRSFYRLWVCKEAFLKSSGKGFLSNNYDFPLYITNFLRGKEVKNPERVYVSPYLFEDIPTYVGAVFVEGSQNIDPVHFTWAHYNI